MNKELNFRFWDNSEKRFVQHYAHQSIPINDTLSLLQNGSRIQIQQYTGLKDVDGIEIYEGDILEFTPSVVNNKNCIWKNLGHVWIPDLYKGVLVSYNHPYSEISNSWQEIEYKFTRELQYKVVGNIFENKELMN